MISLLISSGYQEDSCFGYWAPSIGYAVHFSLQQVKIAELNVKWSEIRDEMRSRRLDLQVVG